MTLIPACISNHMVNRLCDENTYSSPNCKMRPLNLVMYKSFHPTLYDGCNSLSVAVSNLINIGKKGSMILRYKYKIKYQDKIALCILRYCHARWAVFVTVTKCYSRIIMIMINRTIAQIPKYSSPISHNAPLCSRNAHMSANLCYKILHCGIFD